MFSKCRNARLTAAELGYRSQVWCTNDKTDQGTSDIASDIFAMQFDFLQMECDACWVVDSYI